MMRLPKNLVKSVSNFTNRHPNSPISKLDNNFKPAAGKTKDRLLLRRLCYSGVDEDKLSSAYLSKSFLSPTELSSPSFDGIYSPQIEFFCGTATNYYTALCPHTFSPIEIQTRNFPHFNKYRFNNSCGGVVCFDDGNGDVVFWNPTTNEVKLVALNRNHTDDEDEEEPDKYPINEYPSVTTAGLGYDSKSQDYKYARWMTVFEDQEEESGYCRYLGCTHAPQIYSFKRDSWGTLCCPYPIVYADRWGTASINGKIYWAYGMSKEILCLDLASEEFECFPSPRTRKEIGDTLDIRLFDFGGRLGAVFHPFNREEGRFELWVWNGNGNGNGGWWSKEMDDYVEGCHKPLGFSGHLMFLEGIDLLLHVYHLRTKKLKKLNIYCNQHRFDLIPYVETTFPLYG